MKFVQKVRIIKRFLMELSGNPVKELNENDLQPYTELGNLLDYIELHQDGLFHLDTLEIDPNQWREFYGILKYSSTFEIDDPSILKSVNFKKAEEGIKYTRDAHEIITLPQDDYYARPVNIQQHLDAELSYLVETSRAKLYALTQNFLNATPFDPSSSAQISNLIISVQEQIQALSNNHPELKIAQKKLNILLDLNKVNELKQMTILQDNGAELFYCTLAENIGGVTEKISLSSLASVKAQLHHLCTCSERLDIESYTRDRGNYKLSIQAMIKLPKYGDIREVQREAIALNISRLLGLDTATSRSISYNGRPGLFIPFDEIRLLSDFSSGKTFTAWLSGKNYVHYSTIRPVGEGIQADCFINDFGNVLGLLYLCSDTDAIGSVCQNKALRNAKSLFIFDQIMMEANKFILDSRICLIPNQFLKKHTRHGIGRNRTIIEDSLLSTKYESIMQLKATSSKIIQYISHIAWTHQQRIKQIQKQQTPPISEEDKGKLAAELDDLLILKNDAEALKLIIKGRLAALDNILPQTTCNIDATDIRQALIFEKLMHNPVLFSEDGRPYKNPWTQRQQNTIQKIDELNNGYIQLTFGDKVATSMIDLIELHSGGSINVTTPKTITLSKEHLLALKEDLLHPEHRLTLDHSINYLDAVDIAIIKEAYATGSRTCIIKIIDAYRTEMQRGTATPVEKIKCITDTEEKLKEYIAAAKNKGFGMHLMKKFYFEMQKQLQRLINPLEISDNLNDAFIAALKLDRVSEFNAVVLEAIKQEKITDNHFTYFLSQCIQSADAATNYTDAVKESRSLSNAAKETIDHLKILTLALPMHFLATNAITTRNESFAVPGAISEKEYNPLIEQPVVILPTGPSSVMFEQIQQNQRVILRKRVILRS